MAGNTVVRASVDEDIKNEAVAVLASMGLTLSDAFRIMLTRVAAEKALPFDALEPNNETITAIHDAEHGKVWSFNSVEELMEDLNAKD